MRPDCCEEDLESLFLSPNDKLVPNNTSSTIDATMLHCNESDLLNNCLIMPEDDLVTHIMEYLNVYLTPGIVLVGVFGTLLSFLVFTTTYLRRQSSSVYLASLAVADSLFLLVLLCLWLSSIHLPVFHKNVLCQTIVYMSYVSRFLSVWYVVGFTLERYIMIRFPLRKDWFCTPESARKFVCYAALLGLGLYSFATFTNGVVVFDTLPVCMPLDR